MSKRRLTQAAIGLALLAGGPAATLIAAGPAVADPPTCEQACDTMHTGDVNRCVSGLPRLPTQDDMLDFNACISEANDFYGMCMDTCPPPEED